MNYINKDQLYEIAYSMSNSLIKYLLNLIKMKLIKTKFKDLIIIKHSMFFDRREL